MDDLGAAQFLARSVYRSFSTVSQSSKDSDRISWERFTMPDASRLPSIVPGEREDRSMRWNNIEHKTNNEHPPLQGGLFGKWNTLF